jgi:hypothetical protein
VKKVRITLCIPKIWHFFTGEGFEVLQSLRDTKKRKVKVTVEKRPNRAGATPLFGGQAAQEFSGVTPALDAIGVGLFSTVQSRHRKSFMHAFLKPACRKGETAWQF